MAESPITSEVESLLLKMEHDGEWSVAPPPTDCVVEEREATRRCARRVLDVFYDVDRAFKHIELGLVD